MSTALGLLTIFVVAAASIWAVGWLTSPPKATPPEDQGVIFEEIPEKKPAKKPAAKKPRKTAMRKPRKKS